MSPFRKVSLAALLAVTTFGGLVPGGTPAPAQAAKPDATQCQTGFLRPKAPKVSVDCAPAEVGGTAPAGAPPAGFQETVVWSGLVNPMSIRFAADGRVFVAEKSGVIKVFDSLADQTPTLFNNLVTNVQDFWDRGLLGMALDPSLTGGSGTGSYVYVLYTYDHILGSLSPAPRWGDGCPTPPGPTSDGCVVSGRLSRFAVSGSSITGAEQVLVEDWCQQYPSHSLGSLAFGPDGALYVSAGEGANFSTVDYGQRGGTTATIVTPRNPCGDPAGGSMSPPGAEGGALRSQDVRTSGASSTYRHLVTVDAPISYWRLGESTGTSAARELGAQIGTYVGGPTLGAAGPIVGDADTAITLNGSTQYVSVADSSAFRFAGTAPFSAEIWFRHTADGAYRRVISAENETGQGWQIYSQAASWGFVRRDGSGAVEISDGTPAGSGWIHAVATYDGTTMRLYENGVQIPFAYASGQSLPADSTFTIGRYGGADAAHFNGSIDEPAIYDYALTAAQVAAHHAAALAPGTDRTGLNGAILRLNPATGAGMPGNPFTGSSDLNARRIIAYGLRNPFRFTIRPGTNELWVGDVGWFTWEEINRIPNITDSVAENFGWPCYEGAAPNSGYDGTDLALCESLYSQPSAVTAPAYAYNHASEPVPGGSCSGNNSSTTGLAFYPTSGGSFPAAYSGGLFFADHGRDCIWFAPQGANGQPNMAAIQTFDSNAGNPVDVVIGPNGDLFYVDFEGGAIHRVVATGSNQAPTAVIEAVPTGGPAPLSVQFDGGDSSDPEGTTLAYAWDLDGDGQYDDATGVTTSRTYSNPGDVTVRLRVTDAATLSGTTSQVISASNTPPVPTISTPTTSFTGKVGDPIPFSGSATDAQDGALPASALTWSLVIQHCAPGCHPHTVQSLPGISSGSFNAPDHEYPSYLQLILTAKDSNLTSASTTVRLDPKTVNLTFQTAPAGLALAVNAVSSTAPFTRTVIIGSSNSVTATSPQSLSGVPYVFSSWSDGLAQSHQIVAPATNTTYTATYQASSSFNVPPSADAQIRSSNTTRNYGTTDLLRVRSGQSRAYLKFVVTGLTGAASSAKLRLWVTEPSGSGGSVYKVGNGWTETGITWSNAPVISGSPLSTLGKATVGTWVEFNVTSAITGNGTFNFAISGGNSNPVDYSSRETSNDPVLVVTR